MPGRPARRLRLVRRLAGALPALCGAAIVAACSQPVAVPVPTPSSPDVIDACTALHAQLPARVEGQSARTADPDSKLTASWGDPPITLQCGVAEPTALEPTSHLITVDGVDWLPEEHTDGWVFTTTGRLAYVAVTVPGKYQPEANALVDLAGPVSQAVPIAPAAD